MSAAAHASARLSGFALLSSGITRTLGQASCAASVKASAILVLACQPHSSSTMLRPVARAACSSARYCGSGCALAWNDRRPRNSTTIVLSSAPTASRAATRCAGVLTKSCVLIPSGITGNCGNTKRVQPRRFCR
jgi:hypothetical protein